MATIIGVIPDWHGDDPGQQVAREPPQALQLPLLQYVPVPQRLLQVPQLLGS